MLVKLLKLKCSIRYAQLIRRILQFANHATNKEDHQLDSPLTSLDSQSYSTPRVSSLSRELSVCCLPNTVGDGEVGDQRPVIIIFVHRDFCLPLDRRPPTRLDPVPDVTRCGVLARMKITRHVLCFSLAVGFSQRLAEAEAELAEA
jgi:hypothetical protein